LRYALAHKQSHADESGEQIGISDNGLTERPPQLGIVAVRYDEL
jgi:hypothetical protein